MSERKIPQSRNYDNDARSLGIDQDGELFYITTDDCYAVYTYGDEPHEFDTLAEAVAFARDISGDDERFLQVAEWYT